MREQLFMRLKSLSEKLPDLRLGQIISNAISRDVDLFYLEDELLLELLERFDDSLQK